MDKNYIKTQIAMRQAEFPTNLFQRDKPLPVEEGRIVTIPGVRRCGKSSRMENVIKKLLSEGVSRERMLWVSFDDERLVKMTSDDLDLIVQAYREMYPATDMKDVFMFFDEIQLIDGWEYFVMRLYKHYCKNIYISGSNASMLSTELKSALRGWPEEHETLPLSFREYCVFKGIPADSWLEADIARRNNAFIDYLHGGGFPEVVLTENPLKKVAILQGYFDTMLLKDLAEHYGISNLEVLRYFLKRIMANLTKPTSIRGIHSDLKSRGLKISKDDLYNWAKYVCDVFVFLRISNYSRSLQKTENSLPKYYCIDNGLRDAVLLPQSDDDGKKLENVVLLELWRRRTPVDSIFYYSDKTECDFVIQHGTEISQLIQVTWNMSDPDTRDRELRGLVDASKVTDCNNLLIITADHNETIDLSDGRKIQVVPASHWLLNPNI